MNPKKNFHNTTFSVQPPYIAGSSHICQIKDLFLTWSVLSFECPSGLGLVWLGWRNVKVNYRHIYICPTPRLTAAQLKLIKPQGLQDFKL